MGAGILADSRAEPLAICDIYDVQRSRAIAAFKIPDTVKQLAAHEDALALPGVDAVVIAAPDHLRDVGERVPPEGVGTRNIDALSG